MRSLFRTVLVVLGFGSAAIVLGQYLAYRHHFLAAERALKRRDFERALHHLDYSLHRQPGNAVLHLYAAQAARRCGLFERAAQHLAAYDQLHQASKESALEGILLQVQQGEFDKHESRLRKLVMADDASKNLILEAMAQGYVRTCCLKDALLCLQLLLEAEPEHAQALVWRGQIWEKLEGYDAALNDYERAVAIVPQSVKARFHLATMLAKVGRMEEAAGQFDCLRHQQPANVEVLLGLASCRHDLAQLDEAAALVDAALSQCPKLVPALIARGRLAFRQGQFARGESFLRRAIHLAPYDPEAYLIMGFCLQSQGKTEEARQVRDRQQTLADEMTHLRALMLKAIGEGPQEAAVPYQIGMILIRNGQQDEGVRWLRSAIRVDPWHELARKALVDYCQGNDQTERTAQLQP